MRIASVHPELVPVEAKVTSTSVIQAIKGLQLQYRDEGTYKVAHLSRPQVEREVWHLLQRSAGKHGEYEVRKLADRIQVRKYAQQVCSKCGKPLGFDPGGKGVCLTKFRRVKSTPFRAACLFLEIILAISKNSNKDAVDAQSIQIPTLS